MANLISPNIDWSTGSPLPNPQSTSSVIPRSLMEATAHVHLGQTILVNPSLTQLAPTDGAVGYATG